MTRPTADQTKALLSSLEELLADYGAIHPGATMTPVDAFFIYRLLLGRNPDPGLELPGLLVNAATHREFMRHVLACPEFEAAGGFFPPGHFLMAELPGFRFWFNTSDREMGVAMALGHYEPTTVGLVRELVRPGMRCLDIGAQTGFFTCLMASLVGPTGHVHAFEPMPPSFRMIEKNVSENHFEDIVELHPKAVSDAAAAIQASKVSNMYVVGHVDGAEPVTIEAIRVDDVVTEHVDLIKIDVEGHEPAAMRGMEALIHRNRPIIVSEANEYWLRTASNSSTPEFLDLLIRLGYRVYDVDDRGSALNPRTVKLELLDTMNVVAFPIGHTQTIAH